MFNTVSRQPVAHLSSPRDNFSLFKKWKYAESSTCSALCDLHRLCAVSYTLLTGCLQNKYRNTPECEVPGFFLYPVNRFNKLLNFKMSVDNFCYTLTLVTNNLLYDLIIHSRSGQQGNTGMPGIMGLVVHTDLID